MPCNPLIGPPTCKIVGVKSMLSLFSQLRWGTASSLAAPIHSTPPQTPLVEGEASNDVVQRADTAWRSLPDLPLESDRNPMAAFVKSRYKQYRQSLGFKAGAKSYVIGFIAKSFESISFE